MIVLLLQLDKQLRVRAEQLVQHWGHIQDALNIVTLEIGLVEGVGDDMTSGALVIAVPIQAAPLVGLAECILLDDATHGGIEDFLGSHPNISRSLATSPLSCAIWSAIRNFS